VVDGSGALSFSFPAGFADRMRYGALALLATGAQSILARQQAIPDDLTPAEFDYGVDALPQLDSATLDPADPARPISIAIATANLDATDGGMVAFRWTRGEISGVWRAVVPPSALSFRFPALPESLAELAPNAESELAGPEILFLEASFLEDYRAMRARLDLLDGLLDAISTGNNVFAVALAAAQLPFPEGEQTLRLSALPTARWP
jgi:hypothetical protein